MKGPSALQSRIRDEEFFVKKSSIHHLDTELLGSSGKRHDHSKRESQAGKELRISSSSRSFCSWKSLISSFSNTGSFSKFVTTLKKDGV